MILIILIIYIDNYFNNDRGAWGSPYPQGSSFQVYIINNKNSSSNNNNNYYIRNNKK